MRRTLSRRSAQSAHRLRTPGSLFTPCCPFPDTATISSVVTRRVTLAYSSQHLTVHRVPPPIRLGNLDAQFDMRCYLRRAGQPEREQVLTVVRCRTVEPETTRYFLSVAGSLLPMLGNAPSGRDVAGAVQQLAAMFQRILTPASRPVAGLFGELFLIASSTTPTRDVAAWRAGDNARFDFSGRGHKARCQDRNQPGAISHLRPRTMLSAARHDCGRRFTLCRENRNGHQSARVSGPHPETGSPLNPDLVFKLHDIVARTLGTSLNESMAVAFDAKLAASSLQFFDLRVIPAIRDPLPPGVSDVHFRSDLSAVSVLSVRSLSDRDPLFRDPAAARSKPTKCPSRVFDSRATPSRQRSSPE